MKNIKKFLSLVLVILMLSLSAVNVFAAETDSEVFTLTIGSNIASVFGETKENDVQPLLKNGRTMLPARFVAENLGATVSWDDATQTVTVTNDEVVIKITIGSAIATVNDEEVTLDSPAFLENDRTYTPVRFIAESLGSNVSWDEETQTVIMTKPIIVSDENIYIPENNIDIPEDDFNIPDDDTDTSEDNWTETTAEGTLILKNVRYKYVSGGETAELNKNAVGEICIVADVEGPENIEEVLIAQWSVDMPDDMTIAEAISTMNLKWKDEGLEIIETDLPFKVELAHPIYEYDNGCTMYVLILGLDKDGNVAASAIMEELIQF